MKLSKTMMNAALAATLALTAGGLAWAAAPAEQIEFRAEQMKKMGRSMKTIQGFVKNNAGTPADVAAAAATIQQVAKTIPDLFPPGTGFGVANSAAKPDLWQQWDKFKELAVALEKSGAALMETAAKNDAKAIEAGFGQVAKACGACHEPYRMKKE